LEANLKNE
jgi:hypothetical protein